MRRQHAAIGWKWTLAAGAFIGLLVGSGSAAARSLGIDSGACDASLESCFVMQDGAATCSSILTGCHAAASDDVFVTITGPQALDPDETADYTIEIFENVQGALQVGAGLNVVAILDGVLTDLDEAILGENAANTQITETGPFFFVDGQLTHFAATVPDNPAGSIGVFSYDFTVTAPSSPGTLELRGAMNAFNNNGGALGENWNNTSLFITVPEPEVHSLAAAALLAVACLVNTAAPRRRRAC